MFNMKWSQANATGGTGGGDQIADGSKQDAGGNKQEVPVTFDAWLDKQDDAVKGLLEGHTKGLKSALDSERENRKGLEKQLREMAKAAEKGSEAEKKLTGMADEISIADRRADFYEEAHKAGIANLKLAFMVATQEDLFDKQGRVNFDGMKKDYPELFGGTKIPDGDAGSGTEGSPKGGKNMNDLIRRAAGRST